MKTIISAIAFVALVLGITPIAMATLNSNSIIEDGIEYYVQTDKSIYELGENVNILYRVSNLTDSNIFFSAVIDDPLAYYDFRVTQDNNQIWRYPYMSPVLGFGGIFFEPYESKEFQTVWNMMNDNGTIWPITDDFLVSPGTYNVVGEMALFPTYQRVPVSVSINIVPEPSSLLLFGASFLGLLARNRTSHKK